MLFAVIAFAMKHAFQVTVPYLQLAYTQQERWGDRSSKHSQLAVKRYSPSLKHVL